MDLGQRIHVIGNSCSGKSTLAAALAEHLGYPVVELDALNWLPGWVGLNATDPERFRERLRQATADDTWVVAGSYAAFCEAVVWPRLDTMIWLDLPRWQLVLRMLRRSWRRWRTKELLWGTNREKFWPQLMVWRGEDSLLWWIWTQHHRKRANYLAMMDDPQFAHFRIVHLKGRRAVDAFLAELQS